MSNENEADAAPVTPIPHFCVLRLSMPMYRHACIQDRSSIDFPSQGLSTRTTQMLRTLKWLLDTSVRHNNTLRLLGLGLKSVYQISSASKLPPEMDEPQVWSWWGRQFKSAYDWTQTHQAGLRY
ncbi:hypothetical protein TWF751_002500 [Orbilia oligospora]|nr:hypothetical protein TWF751_002500 [Orbilia oligospora]